MLPNLIPVHLEFWDLFLKNIFFFEISFLVIGLGVFCNPWIPLFLQAGRFFLIVKNPTRHDQVNFDPAPSLGHSRGVDGILPFVPSITTPGEVDVRGTACGELPNHGATRAVTHYHRFVFRGLPP